MWLLNETPSSIHRKLNLPDQDQGIDLICETNDGEYWAVQAKYHEDETTSQTWRSLSTFTGLAFGVCKNISFGLVCTTSERYTKTLKNQDNIGFCTGEIWRGLDEDFFTSLTRKRKPKKLKAYKPFNHQKRAIKEAHKHYVTNNESRGKMIMPCGTGKSLTAFWIAEKLHSKMILVAVPSLSLIRQTLQVWLRETYAKGWDVDWITVCSDKTVSKMEKDDLAVLTQDLGIPAVTDPKVIASWLRKRHSGRVVVFTTYQSGKAIAEATRLARRNFDLGIMDEAHKTVGKKDKTFAHLLFDENIKISKRVFMTATERRYTGIQDTIVSMDDYDVYGETFEFLSFKDALDEDPPILSDYKIVTVMVGNDEIAELVKAGKFVKPSRGKWDDEIQADTFASLVALRKAVKKYRIKHALSFHSNIARAEAYQENQEIFTELFTDYQKMDTFFVSGKMPTSVRDRHLRDFESSKRALISNARCLTEGVDVPDIDCVLFADPKRSTIDIVQAVGRALRKSEGKKFGYVIVPVVIEKEGQGFEESQAFESILMTLRALASNDERIIDYFRDKANRKRTERKVIIDIPEQLAEKIDEKEFVRELELKAWNKLAKLSWRPFNEARDFARSLGLKNQGEWSRYSSSGQRPPDIPGIPARVYKNNGWVSIGDWLGTGRIASQNMIYMPFDEALKFARSSEIKTAMEWVEKWRANLLPEGLSAHPQRTYKNNGWIDWGHFLGVRSRYFYDLLDFEEARDFARSLGLKNQGEWKKYIRGELKDLPELPNNIPKNPHYTYKNSGYIGIGDWLGTGRAPVKGRYYLPFDEARKYVHTLNLKGTKEWYEYAKSDNRRMDLPFNPDKNYREKGWINWGDWIGTKTIATGSINYQSFNDARKFARSLKLKSQREWFEYCKGKVSTLPPKPENIPTSVERIYKDKGWINFGDFLGTGTIAPQLKEFRTFDQAKKFAQRLNLKSYSEWQKYTKGNYKNLNALPKDIPLAPHYVYKNKGWIGYGDFLGYGMKDFLTFHEARAIIRKMKFQNVAQWRNFTKSGEKPSYIPTTPERVYKNKGWVNFSDWIGIKRVANQNKKYMAFKSAKEFAHKLKLKGITEWRNYCKGMLANKPPKPADIPVSVERVYKNNGWKNWGDFLGTGTIASFNIKFRNYQEAKKFVANLNLRSQKEWRMYNKGMLTNLEPLPNNIPRAPEHTYKAKGEWISWPNFLGYEPERKKK